MAAVKGVNRTVLDAADNDHTLDPGLAGGVVRVMVDTYEASALASGSTIKMGGTLPKNCRVLAVGVWHDALGAATISIGDAEVAARYLSGYSVASAGQKWGDLADGVEYEVDESVAATLDSQVVITTAAAAITGTIKLVVLYTKD